MRYAEARRTGGEDLPEAGAGGAWLERRAEAGWGLHWSKEDQGHGERVGGGACAQTRAWGGLG